ncbi:MAG: PilZ domain-containing protein [Gammaproteobacteria bacterium]|nr:PilZ domain-containing protein [Gammaproteobacteria bacterium]
MAEAPKPAPPAMGRQGIMSLSLKDKGALYAAYMPFIKNGGMFIPSAKAYQLGDEVFILLTLMDETEKLPVAGRIVWLTPKGAQGNRPAGIGVQFSEIDGGSTRSKIEGYLAGLLQAERATNTL